MQVSFDVFGDKIVVKFEKSKVFKNYMNVIDTILQNWINVYLHDDIEYDVTVYECSQKLFKNNEIKVNSVCARLIIYEDELHDSDNESICSVTDDERSF